MKPPLNRGAPPVASRHAVVLSGGLALAVLAAPCLSGTAVGAEDGSGRPGSAQAPGGGGADPAAASFIALPFPARVLMLVEDGEMAGRPVTIAAFETELTPIAMQARLRRAWSGDLRRPWLQTQSGDWEVVSRQTPQGMVTLQYQGRDSGGARGLVSFWPRGAGESTAVPPVAIPSVATRLAELAAVLPEDSRIAETVSRDGRRRTLTVMARSAAQPDGVWRRLDAGLREQGYQLRRGPGEGTGLARTRSAVFVRRDRELIVTLDGRGAEVGIVMQLVETGP